jgi:hypothetical protein
MRKTSSLILSAGGPDLRALCQRCHMLHDRSHHLTQRWITYRRRSADGDLFLGPYSAMMIAAASSIGSEA